MPTKKSISKNITSSKWLIITQWMDKKQALNIKEDKMPLVKGKKAATRQGMSENISREVHSGKPKNQAVAIAYSLAKEKKRR